MIQNKQRVARVWRLPAPLCLLLGAVACSANLGGSGAGGRPGSGGETATGGATATGGNTATGGTPSTGGSPQTGGTTGTGGLTGSGGITGRGGSTATGGATSTGGATGTGFTDGKALRSTELYDPATDRWTPGTDLLEARYGGHALALQDGSVLVLGGANDFNTEGDTPWCPTPLVTTERLSPRP